MKYFFLAGERSGDLHASNLAAALKNLDPGFSAQGFGGDRMRAQGIEIVCGLERLSFMGFWEVVKHLWTILQNFRIAKKAIRSFHPDVVILIDNPGFNMRLAKWCRKNGYKMAYYILPQVWAWHTSRVYQLRDTCDRLIGVLPFEKEFYLKHGVPMEYVGHPLLDHIPPQGGQGGDLPLRPEPVEGRGGHIALLPGSRAQELQRHLPDMLDTARLLPDKKFVIAALSPLKDLYPDELPGNVQLEWDNTYAVLQHAGLAVVCSGTATLETALLGVPQVVVYKTGWVNAQLVRLLARVPYAALPNLIAGKKIVEELLQWDCTAERIGEELEKLYRADPVALYEPVLSRVGEAGASAKAASIIFSLADKP